MLRRRRAVPGKFMTPDGVGRLDIAGREVAVYAIDAAGADAIARLERDPAGLTLELAFALYAAVGRACPSLSAAEVQVISPKKVGEILGLASLVKVPPAATPAPESV